MSFVHVQTNERKEQNINSKEKWLRAQLSEFCCPEAYVYAPKERHITLAKDIKIARSLSTRDPGFVL